MCRIKIRAHHGLCTCFFEGKGYSDSFSKKMGDMIDLLSQNPPVKVVCETDDICVACPKNKDSVCEDCAKVLSYDQAVLQLTSVKQNQEIYWQDFADLVKEKILKSGEFSSVCGDCHWAEICHKKF